MITPEECRKKVKKALSEKRYRHTLNVCELAVELARRHGEDPQKAATAALLHDYCKELPKEELLQILHRNAIMAGDMEKRPQPLWHGVCAAIVAEEKGWVRDPEILNAMCCHTAGRVGMTSLDKILFLADMTSAERRWDGVEQLRMEAFDDLDAAMIHGLAMNLAWLRESGKPVDPLGEAALRDLKERTGNAR